MRPLWVVTLASSQAALSSSCAGDGGSLPEAPDAGERIVVPAPVIDGGACADGAAAPCDGGASLTCEEADWCLESPETLAVIGGHTLTDLGGTGESDVWAVGSAGRIIHYDGTTWSLTPAVIPLAPPSDASAPTDASTEMLDRTLTYTFTSVLAASPDTVWVATPTASVLMGRSAGAGRYSWTYYDRIVDKPREFVPTYTTLAGSGADLYGLVRDDLSGYYMDETLTAAEVVTVRSDPSASVLLGERIRALKASSPEYVTPNVGLVPSRGLWISPEREVWVLVGAGLNVGQLREDAGVPEDAGDGGRAGLGGPGSRAWRSVVMESAGTLWGVWGATSDDVWVVGTAGRIRRIRRHETLAESIESPTKNTLHAVWGTSASDIWAVGDGATVLHYDGASWSISKVALPFGSSPGLYSVWGASSGAVWVAGSGVLLRHHLRVEP